MVSIFETSTRKLYLNSLRSEQLLKQIFKTFNDTFQRSKLEFVTVKMLTETNNLNNWDVVRNNLDRKISGTICGTEMLGSVFSFFSISQF